MKEKYIVKSKYFLSMYISKQHSILLQWKSVEIIIIIIIIINIYQIWNSVFNKIIWTRNIIFNKLIIFNNNIKTVKLEFKKT